METTHKRYGRVSLFLWTAAAFTVAAAIFFFSSQPAEQSAELSRDFVANLSGQLLTKASDEEVLLYTHIARKLAHFSLYFLLGASLSGVMRRQRRLPALPAAIGAGTIYAALDEFHQRFVPGRGPQLTDVLLDACGVTAGALLTLALLRWIQRKKDD